MTGFKKNKKVWEEIYKKGRLFEYPDDNLIRFIGYLPVSRGKLLDLGFGTGNNFIYLAKHFTCSGCEISPTSIALTKKRLDKLGISVDLKLFDGGIPYPDNYFDVVVSWQALYYNDEKGLDLMLNEIERVLKSDGCFLVTMLKKNKADGFDKITGDVYRINAKRPAQTQEGAIVYMADKKGIKKLFKRFSPKIGYFEWEFMGRQNAQWVIYGENKK